MAAFPEHCALKADRSRSVGTPRCASMHGLRDTWLGSAFCLLGTMLLRMFVHQALLILSSQARAPSPGGANGGSFLEGGWWVSKLSEQVCKEDLPQGALVHPCLGTEATNTNTGGRMRSCHRGTHSSANGCWLCWPGPYVLTACLTTDPEGHRNATIHSRLMTKSWRQMGSLEASDEEEY